jgi:hypothetical protein
MTEYAPANWYWIVGDDASQVYSSASAATVGTGDKAYKAWLAQGNAPTRIATMDELKDVLIAAGVIDVPQTISDRQFFQQLAIAGIISQEEALAAVKTGDIPAALSGFIAALDDAARFNAEMLLSGATLFQRAHPLTDAIAAAQGMTPDQVDDFFRAAAAL